MSMKSSACFGTKVSRSIWIQSVLDFAPKKSTGKSSYDRVKQPTQQAQQAMRKTSPRQHHAIVIKMKANKYRVSLQ